MNLRRLQFRLRTMLLGLTAISVGLGALVWRERENYLTALAEGRASDAMSKTFDSPIEELETAAAPWTDTTQGGASALYEFWRKEVNRSSTANDFTEAGYFRVKSAYSSSSAAELEAPLLANYRRSFEPLGMKLSETQRDRLSLGTRTTFKFIDSNRNVHADITVVAGPYKYFYIQGNTGTE